MTHEEDDLPDSDPDDHLHNQLHHFLESEQWERAHEVLIELLKRDSLSSYLHYQSGIVCLQLKKFEQSEHHLKKAISLDPDDPDHYQAMAYLKISQNRFLESEEFARKAIKLAPLDHENWILMGDLCRVQDDKPQASICLEKARELAPESTDVLRLTADLALMQEGVSLADPDGNLRKYEEVLSRDPENETALYSTGVIYLEEKNDYEQAERFLRAALKQDPHDKDYEKALIRTFRKRDPFLRLLWLPLMAGLRVGIWCLVLIPYLYFRYPGGGRTFAGYLALGLFLAFLFWPITKLYEALTISEVHKQIGSVKLTGSRFQALHRLPYPVRLSVFISIALLIWALIARLLTTPAARDWMLKSTGAATAISFLGILLFLVFHSIRKHHRENKRASKNAPLFDKQDLHQ